MDLAMDLPLHPPHPKPRHPNLATLPSPRKRTPESTQTNHPNRPPYQTHRLSHLPPFLRTRCHQSPRCIAGIMSSKSCHDRFLLSHRPTSTEQKSLSLPDRTPLQPPILRALLRNREGFSPVLDRRAARGILR